MLTVVLLTRMEGRRWEYCASVAASTRNVSARPLQLAAAGAAAAGQDAATSGRKSSEVGAASSQPTSPSTSSSVRCSSDNGDNTNLGNFFYRVDNKYFSAQTCSGTLAGGRAVLRRGRGRQRPGTGGQGATSCCPGGWRGRCLGSRPRPGTRGGCCGAPAVLTVTQLPCQTNIRTIFHNHREGPYYPL